MNFDLFCREKIAQALFCSDFARTITIKSKTVQEIVVFV